MKTRLLLAAALLLPTAARAQSSSFILILGNDTIAVETFTRTTDHLSGQLTTRGMGPRLVYSLDLAGGTATVLHNAAYTGQADSTLAQSAVLTFKGDSVIADITTKGNTVTQRIASQAGAFPFINPSMALFEPVLAKAQALGGAVATVQLFTVSGGQTFPATVTRLGVDSATIAIGGAELRVRTNANGDILGGVVPSQNLRIVRVGGTASLSEQKLDYSAPANAAYTAEDVKINGPAGTLAGTLTLPKNRAAKVPVVVTISGSGLQDRDEALPIVSGYKPFRQIAEALAANGVAVLRYDDRGYGASTGNPSMATTQDFANDAAAVLAYLRTRTDVDASRLFLLGHSEGGVIAPMIAAKDPHVRGIILMAGTSRTGKRVLEYQNRYAIDQQPNIPKEKKDSLYRDALAGLDSMQAKQPWLHFFYEYDPLPTIKGVKAPVLILQGANDRQVTADQAEELAAALRSAGNKDVEIHVLPGVNHLFLADPDGSPAGYASLKDRSLVAPALQLLTDWVRKHAK